ncbi:SDR family oxidoreductase [Brucella pseudogrignonensis]|uniref:NAD(P)-dependent dehydrogenase (Short-subunit alcohol dehydrogenase family) n=1 Tax=Brucella pseudogrignonensis TaxID=419475 RepID=A0ABU1MC97_9HYPH|nr:SDR family oxidoreductase [Brucella pseudogrignonensis]MDR6433381.1 NAD(P)-dependent dehydrogenase (short-subunit alcohol dehydrogenase family) [Brucella pseudogrignonensis]
MIHNSPIALITGANKGIGHAIAQQLGKAGHIVWLGCRDISRGEIAARTLRADGIDARPLQLDVTDGASVSNAAKTLQSETDHLDVLVNNAGLMFGSPSSLAEESIDEMQHMFDTNVLGVMRVTQAFLPLLRKSKAARIVMMSSGLSSLTDALDMRSETWSVGFAGYCASKTALNMLTVKLAKELDREGIKVNAVDPGLTSTDMTGNGPGHSPEEGARAAVALATTYAYGPTAGFYAYTSSGEIVLKRW